MGAREQPVCVARGACCPRYHDTPHRHRFNPRRRFYHIPDGYRFNDTPDGYRFNDIPDDVVCGVTGIGLPYNTPGRVWWRFTPYPDTVVWQ